MTTATRRDGAQKRHSDPGVRTRCHRRGHDCTVTKVTAPRPSRVSIALEAKLAPALLRGIVRPVRLLVIARRPFNVALRGASLAPRCRDARDDRRVVILGLGRRLAARRNRLLVLRLGRGQDRLVLVIIARDDRLARGDDSLAFGRRGRRALAAGEMGVPDEALGLPERGLGKLGAGEPLGARFGERRREVVGGQTSRIRYVGP